jgi:hypothetical protein
LSNLSSPFRKKFQRRRRVEDHVEIFIQMNYLYSLPS